MENHYTITLEKKVGLHHFNCPQNAFAKTSASVVHFELIKVFVCLGSMSTVRVGSRSLPMSRLVIVCLGIINTILLLAAVVIGIYCEYNWSKGVESLPHLLLFGIHCSLTIFNMMK